MNLIKGENPISTSYLLVAVTKINHFRVAIGVNADRVTVTIFIHGGKGEVSSKGGHNSRSHSDTQVETRVSRSPEVSKLVLA